MFKMLTKSAKICFLLVLVIVVAVTTATTTTATPTKTTSTEGTTITNDETKGNEMKLNKTMEKIETDVEQTSLAMATSSPTLTSTASTSTLSSTTSTTTSTATPTTTATTSTTTARTTTTTAITIGSDDDGDAVAVAAVAAASTGNEAGEQISNAAVTPTTEATPPTQAITAATRATTRLSSTAASTSKTIEDDKLMMSTATNVPKTTTTTTTTFTTSTTPSTSTSAETPTPTTTTTTTDHIKKPSAETEMEIEFVPETPTEVSLETATVIIVDPQIESENENENENEDSSASSSSGAADDLQQAAAAYQVAETLADLNEEERIRYDAVLAQRQPPSKLNIVDLYPIKLDQFQRASNEQLLRERTIFTQPENAEEYRQNLMPNEVDNNQLQSNDNNNNNDGQRMTVNQATLATPAKLSDFTGKLLAEQDELITEIERKFQLKESTTSATTTTTTTERPGGKSIIGVLLGAGDSFIERRVKKSFDFPLHRGSDVMAMPHVDFANTKFNTDNGVGAMGGDSTSLAMAAGASTSAGSSTHPEFSTTKFYNSKELYNEMLIHNKRKLMKTAKTTPTTEAAAAGAAGAVVTTTPPSAQPSSSPIIKSSMELSKSLRKSLEQQQQKDLAAISASDPGKLASPSTATSPTSATRATPSPSPSSTPTSTKSMTTMAWQPAPATATANIFKRVTLTPTMQSFRTTTTTTTTSRGTRGTSRTNDGELATTTLLPTTTTTPTTKKYQQELKRAKLLLKAAILPVTNSNNKATLSPPLEHDNLKVVGDKVNKNSTPQPPPAPPAAATTTTTQLEGAVAPAVNRGVTMTMPSHRYIAKPMKSAVALKPIARPRILSRLQEKINSLECEIQNVPQDSHLWRGNETHELLLPIVTTEHCKPKEPCTPNVLSWRGEAEIQSGDILIVEINDAMLNPTHEANNTSSAAHATQVYQVTRSGHEHCDVTEGVLLDITPLVVDGRKLVTLYDKDLTEGVNLLIVVSELWGTQCVRLKVTTKTDNCGENADCSGKGVCYSNVGMEEYECQCCSGFAGPHCEEIDACNPSPCTNNGICVDLSQGHEGNSYQCLCPYGYGGKNCQYESDPCNPAECMNGGSCVGNSTHFRCDCSPGYAGPLCQHSLNECESSPCVHGICVDQEDGFRCFCQPGFAGELCNFEYNECESNPCQNGGECIDHIGSYECRCTKGYTGNRCQIKVDFCANKPCPEGHHCIDHGNDFSCECPGGRNGPDCNQMPRTYFQQCTVNPCTHGGTCWSSGDSFYCACRPGYTGTMCEDEFVVETVVSSSEFIVDDANARNFNDKTFGSSVVLKSPIELHNAYFAAGVLAAAIFIVAVVVTICHCKVNQTYRKFSTRPTSFIPILGFSRRPPKIQGKLNKHWLSGKGGVTIAPTGSSTTTPGGPRTAQSTRHLPSQPNGSNSQTQTTLGGQLHERPFQRHLAMNLENDMYYTVDFSENSQHSPLIQ